MLSITGTYQSPAMLQRWGRLPPGPCSLCLRGNTHSCTQCHLQTVCEGTKSARIAAHHALRATLSTLLVKSVKGWESHPEFTLEATRVRLQGLGLRVPELPPFSHHAQGAPSPEMVDWARASMWRPDDTLIHPRLRRLVLLEFTRAWDGSIEYDERQHDLKGRRYAAWLAHLRAYLAPRGWHVAQANFTVGSRGSILHSRWEHLLDEFQIPLTTRARIYTSMHHQALSSLFDVFQEAKAARRKQASS
jgi:hypothetical protein